MPRNRSNQKGRNISQWMGGIRLAPKDLPEMQKWVESKVNGGMITTLDPVDIPLNSLQMAKNAKTVFDKTSRRDGLVLFDPDGHRSPDENPVLKMASAKNIDGSGHTLRFTRNSVYDLQGNFWEGISGHLNGTDNDRISVVNLMEYTLFANNGVDPIQIIDFNTSTYSDLFQNSPHGPDVDHETQFRYITSFYNRVIGAAWRNNNEVLVAWSGEYGSNSNDPYKGLGDWNPAINETAGFNPLIESPADLSDFITGIFNMSAVLVILRERSLWVGTRQPSFSNPFNFYTSVPGIGCDSPYSIKLTAHGLCWLDRNSRTVYLWSPGSQPEPIGRPIERTLISNITDPQLVFAVYDSVEDAYSVCIPSVASTLVRVWTFYFREKAWNYHEIEGLSSFDEVELLEAAVTIDDLVGTMGGLVGTYENLSPVNESTKVRVYGRTDGSLVIPDPNIDVDAGLIINESLQPDIEFETDITSKVFTIPENDIYIAKIVVEYEMRVGGTLELWYSIDGKRNFVLGDSFTPDEQSFGVAQIITFQKVLKSRRFAWSLRASSGQFDILSYEVHVYPSGTSSMVNQIN